MDILVNVKNQKLKVWRNQRAIVEGTNKFIRFVFKFEDDWDGLTKVVKFVQNDTEFEITLDSEDSAYLPSEIEAGDFTVTVRGTGQNVTATTNVLTLHAKKRTPF